MQVIKLEFNNKRCSGKDSNIWRLNNTLTQYQLVIEEIKEEIRNFLEYNENLNTTYQNVWDTANAVLGGKFIAMSAYVKNTESSQTNDLMLHPKDLERQEQAKHKTRRRRESQKQVPKLRK
jgi:hypothetical protein